MARRYRRFGELRHDVQKVWNNAMRGRRSTGYKAVTIKALIAPSTTVTRASATSPFTASVCVAAGRGQTAWGPGLNKRHRSRCVTVNGRSPTAALKAGLSKLARSIKLRKDY